MNMLTSQVHQQMAARSLHCEVQTYRLRFLMSFLSYTLTKSREQTTKHQLRGIRQCRKKKTSKEPSLNIFTNIRRYLCSGYHFKERQRTNLLLEINSMLLLLSHLTKIKFRNQQDATRNKKKVHIR